MTSAAANCPAWCDDRGGHPDSPTHHRFLGEVDAGESRVDLTMTATDSDPAPIVSIALHTNRPGDFIGLAAAQQLDLMRLLTAALAIAAGVAPAIALPAGTS